MGLCGMGRVAWRSRACWTKQLVDFLGVWPGAEATGDGKAVAMVTAV